MKTALKPPPPAGDAGKLLGTRRGSLSAAIVATILAAAVLLVFLQHYRSSVGGSNKTETVLVARSLLAKGTSGDLIASNSMFQAINIKHGQVKNGALTEPGALRGLVTTETIFPGEQLTSAEFGPAQHTVVEQLSGDQRAIAVPVDTPHGLVGDLHPGDHVDVYGVYTVHSSGGAGDVQVVRELDQDVPVLKASNGAGGGGLGGGSQQEVVLNVPEQAAGKLALTGEYGKVWLTMRPAGGAQNASTPSTDAIDTILTDANSADLTNNLNALGAAVTRNLQHVVQALAGAR